MWNFGAINFRLAYSVVCGFVLIFTFKHIVFKPNVGYISNNKIELIPTAATHAFNTLAKDDNLLDKAKKLFADKH